jgi:hypothetical protein
MLTFFNSINLIFAILKLVDDLHSFANKKKKENASCIHTLIYTYI